MTDESATQDAHPLTRKIGAEALGTFVLVFFGAGTAVVSNGDLVAIALAFGLAVMVMAFAVGHVSGGHFNPAISVGAAMSGRMPWTQVAVYAAVQVGAAIVAALALFVLLQGIDGFEAEGRMGQNFFGGESPNDFAVWAAFLLELLTTAIFVSIALAATDRRNPSPLLAPVAIGLGLTMIHLATINLTGTSVNPARSIGPGLFAGFDAILQLWLFLLAPLAGAALAGAAYPLVFGKDGEPVPGSGFTLPERRKKQGGTTYAGTWDPQHGPYGAPPPPAWDPQSQQWTQQPPASWHPDDPTRQMPQQPPPQQPLPQQQPQQPPPAEPPAEPQPGWGSSSQQQGWTPPPDDGEQTRGRRPDGT